MRGGGKVIKREGEGEGDYRGGGGGGVIKGEGKGEGGYRRGGGGGER